MEKYIKIPVVIVFILVYVVKTLVHNHVMAGKQKVKQNEKREQEENENVRWDKKI